jgi:hypothetical protein
MLVPLVFEVRAEVIVDTASGKVVDYVLNPDEPRFVKAGRTDQLSSAQHYELQCWQLVPPCQAVKNLQAQRQPLSKEEINRAIEIVLAPGVDFGASHIAIAGELQDVSGS